MELLNKVSLYYGTIIVTYQNVSGFLYYRSSIGGVRNLAAGDIMYTNQTLTSFPTSGNYYQNGVTNDETKHCNTSAIMVMVLNSSGVITSISCALP